MKYTRHGMCNTKFYYAYRSAKARCQTKSHASFRFYGLKGIKFEWKNFLEFKKDMYESFLQHIFEFGEWQTTLDRLNPKGNYCKENCRWATWSEQGKNRSSTRHTFEYLNRKDYLKKWRKLNREKIRIYYQRYLLRKSL